MSISFCRLIKRRTKIFRPFDRLVLFRLPLQRLKTSGDGSRINLDEATLAGFLPLFFSSFFFFFLRPRRIQWHVHLEEEVWTSIERRWEGTSIGKRRRFRASERIKIVVERQGTTLTGVWKKKNRGRKNRRYCRRVREMERRKTLWGSVYETLRSSSVVFFLILSVAYRDRSTEFVGAWNVFEKTTPSIVFKVNNIALLILICTFLILRGVQLHVSLRNFSPYERCFRLN